jgi:Fusaric acid resistance protein family
MTGMIMANTTSKYRAELRLVIRALTAAALSLVAADALALPQSYWAVFTALIIVQSSVGGTLAAGLDRFVGTLAGAVLGAAVALTGEFWRVPQVVLLLLAVAPVALLAAIRPSFRIAPVTAAILLLTTPSNASPIISAMDRVVEISLGTFIGIVVSIFVLPSRARRICFERSAEMLKLLAQVLVLHLQRPDSAKLDEIERLNQRIRVDLAKVEAAAEEARREHLIRVAEGPVPERLLRTLRRLRSDVAFVGRATAGNDFDWQGLGLVTAEIASAFRLVFEALSGTLLHDTHLPDLTELDKAMATLRIVTDSGGNPRSPHSAIALPFVIDTLRRDLGDLIDALVRPATA